MKKQDLEKLIENTIRKVLSESPEGEFMTKNAMDINQALKQLRDLAKIYYNAEEKDLEQAQQDASEKLKNIDKKTLIQINKWIESGKFSLTAVVNFAIANYKSDPQKLLDAIEMWYRTITKILN